MLEIFGLLVELFFSPVVTLVTIVIGTLRGLRQAFISSHEIIPARVTNGEIFVSHTLKAALAASQMLILICDSADCQILVKFIINGSQRT